MSAVAKEVVPPGRFIYAFCNVRTNQVLYSLSRTLDNSALKQLPDLGANHTPPVLRKDLWRPLYRVELPATPEGAKQGLHALKKLREYRKLHELSWEQTSMMTRNHTEKEIEKEKKKLENRGGSKKETVYDIIKRQKHKMKVKMVMDQKANSIADLAAVLLEQEELGVKTTEVRQVRAEDWRTRTLEELERLIQEADNGGVENLKTQIATMRNTLHAMQKDGTEGQRGKLKKKIHDTETQLRKMRHAAKIAKEIPAEAGEIERLAREADGGMLETLSNQIDEMQERLEKLRKEPPRTPRRRESQEIIEKYQEAKKLKRELREQIQQAKEQLEKMQIAAATVKAVQARAEPMEEGNPGESFAAAYRREALLSYAETFDPAKRDPETLPKRGFVRREIERRNSPTFTTEGVTVKWANIMDAEYAGMWPDAVQHERMGYTTRSPPRIDTKTVAEYKALQWKGRRENFQLEESTAEKVERLRAEMGLQPREDKPWKFEEIKELGSEFLPGRDPSEAELAAVKSAEGEVNAAQETVEEAAVEDPNRLEALQKEILERVQQKAAQESWDRRAELDLKRAMNKYKLAPLPADAPMDQQPTI